MNSYSNHYEAIGVDSGDTTTKWIEDLEQHMVKSHDRELRLKRMRRAQRTAAAVIACKVAHGLRAKAVVLAMLSHLSISCMIGSFDTIRMLQGLPRLFRRIS